MKRQILSVDKNKCVNCHQCIAVCPVKFPNNGSQDYVEVNNDLCINCGECIKACTHNARVFEDDISLVIGLLKEKKPVIAIAAPAVSSNFAELTLNLNGWLQSIGVEEFFDVSFGAEVTVQSYLDYVIKNKPKTVITQPCPAIVRYIEIYQPELLPYLAPVDSPMMHTVKMIREFYPKFKNHTIMVLSPCIAKRHEFDEVTKDVYNVTVRNLTEYLKTNKIDLSKYKKIDYHLPHAGYGAGFSNPGGLLETVANLDPSLRPGIRKIEGPMLAYDYLRKLPQQIEMGNAPLIVDILNCENGCNGGTGTNMQHASPDELEAIIRKRIDKFNESDENPKKLAEDVRKFWKEALYIREYVNLGLNYTSLKNPQEQELDEIMLTMHKTKPEHKLNCASCGYNSCDTMAKAIVNNLNKKENCHYFLQEEMKMINTNLDKTIGLRTAEANMQREEVVNIAEELITFLQRVHTIIEEK